MLLLSRGLAVSFRDLLEGAGFDVRVTAGQFIPSRGPMVRDAAGVRATLEALPEIESAVPLRFGRAEIIDAVGDDRFLDFMGVSGDARGTWTVIEGAGLPRDGWLGATLYTFQAQVFSEPR